MILLLAALLACHYLADFVLTLPAMIRAKADGSRLWPIALHAAIHGALIAVCLAVYGAGWLLVTVLALLEFITHFAFDLAKARLTRRFAAFSDTTRRPYWLLFGLDQLLHQLVLITIFFITLAQYP